MELCFLVLFPRTSFIRGLNLLLYLIFDIISFAVLFQNVLYFFVVNREEVLN